ncbi:MAG: hypothetical protein EA349_01995, partial [Halomonadaceae bacterium]
NGKNVLLDSSYGGEDATNYVFVDQDTTTASITPREVSVNGISASDRVYDGTRDADVDVSDAVFADFIAGDDVQVTATGEFVSRNVDDSQTVTLASTYSGDDVGNYSFVDQATTTASITPRALSVFNLVARDKVYDGTTDASINVSLAILEGMIGDDEVALAQLEGQFADRNVGDSITVTTGEPILFGAEAQNYTIAPISNLSARITPRDLAVTAAALDKVFDGTRAVDVTILDNRVRPEDELRYYFTAQFTQSAPASERVAQVSEITLEGADAGNYRLLNTTTTTFAAIRPLTLFDTDQNADQRILENQSAAQRVTGSPETRVLPPQQVAEPHVMGPGMAEGDRTLAVLEPMAFLVDVFGPEAALQLVAQPRPGEQAQAVTLSEVALMTGLPEDEGVDTAAERRRISVPLNNRSLVDIVDGGVSLPEGVEQLLFVTQ